MNTAGNTVNEIAPIASVFGLRVMRIIARIIFNFNNIRCV